MKEFNGKEEKVNQILNRISQSNLKENSHLYPDYGAIKIIDAAEDCLTNTKKEDSYPAIIFLRVVLAANRDYNKHVRPNIKRIQTKYPQLKSFEELDKLINSISRSVFYELWGHKNSRKYNVLKNLMKATEVLRSKYQIEDDFLLMRTWAEKVDIKKLHNDEIGKIKDVALATVQHLRMDFGIDTVKPDRRVIEVLEREFVHHQISQKKAIQLVEELTRITGIKTRTIDLILVNYGSGYYDNRKFSSKFMIQLEIAKKLIKMGVDDDIVAKGTELQIETIKEIKENSKEQIAKWQ